jgi:NAD(P)-dependent dehydrogenase (short-subunit alcohol dehydrogenase family)
MTGINRRQFLQASAAGVAVTTLPACGGDHTISLDATLPIGPYGADSTAEDVTEGMDLSGKTALVTGCNSGIGYETLRVLALRGAHVIGTGRTLEKAQKACDSVAGNTTPVALELSDFESCVACAETVAEIAPQLDMLILNAGIGTFTDYELINGVEKIWVVNYLGHFILGLQLLPLVQAAEGGRIVHVGSQMGYMSAPEGGIDFDNLRGEGEYDAMAAYGRSKLANALFSLKLSELLDPEDTTSNVIHPGFVQSNIGRNADGFVGWIYNGVLDLVKKTPAEGAATQVYVATSPELAGISGAYFEDCNPVTIEGPNHVFDRELADRLWEETLVMVADYLPSPPLAEA